jgi:hypothetical protein
MRSDPHADRGVALRVNCVIRARERIMLDASMLQSSVELPLKNASCRKARLTLASLFCAYGFSSFSR